MAETPPDPPSSDLAAAVSAIAAKLHRDRIGGGPLATLRRINPRQASAEPALHRLLAEHRPDLPAGEVQRWTLIVHALALAAPERLQRAAGLGEPLFRAGFSEMRMTQLLEARPDDLPVVVPRAVRFLVARGGVLDPVALAYFVLDLTGAHKRAEEQRQRVARDYYRAERAARQPA